MDSPSASTPHAPIPAEAVPPQHPDDRIRIFSLCLGGGPAFGVFAFLLIRERLNVELFGFNLVLTAILGFFAGLACLPFVYFTLRNRDCVFCSAVVAWVVAAAVLLLTALPGYTAAGAALFGAPVALIITSAVLALRMPRVYRGACRCGRCGYDLRASVPIGRCPECGTAVRLRPESLTGPSRRTNLVRRLTAIVACHPIGLIGLVIFLYIANALAFDTPRWPPEEFNAAVQEAMDKGTELRLADVTDFEWEQAHLIGGYTNNERINDQLGFKWSSVGRPDISMTDGQQLLVFVKNQRVVRYCVLPDVTRTHGIEFAGTTPFDHSVRFSVGYDPKYKTRLRLTALAAPDGGGER